MKFRHLKQQMLLAYLVSLDGAQLVLMGYGAHENFYRDLKR
jgi:ParE-like toxin of type II bacterial toxin-antitoxin system